MSINWTFKQDDEPKYLVHFTYGHCESEMRYVQIDANTVECQSRAKTFNDAGVLTKVTEWGLNQLYDQRRPERVVAFACNVAQVAEMIEGFATLAALVAAYLAALFAFAG